MLCAVSLIPVFASPSCKIRERYEQFATLMTGKRHNHEISGAISGVAEDSRIVGLDVVSFGLCGCRRFQGKIVRLSSVSRTATT